MQLLERGPIQVELSHLLHEATGEKGRLVFLGGEAGIGKTSLVQRFAQVVRARARVLSGACDPLSTPRPLGPLLDMQERLSRRYADLLTNQGDRDRLARGFLAELSGSDPPSVAIVEDVHWADEATLDLLRFLGRRIGSAPALLIATYRNDEVGDRHPLRIVLGDLATLPAVRRLRLEPLSLAAVRTLAAGSALDAERLHEQTGGNPFFITEVIAAGGEGIPATVRDAVLARAARLPPEAREVLDAAAVLGFRFEPWLLEAVVGPASGAVDACLAGGMLCAQGERLAFRHELAREAILAVLPPHRTLGLHREALEALRSQPEESRDLRRLAHHAEGAGDAAAVLEYAPQAGRRASEVSAHREAADQYARALRFADDQPPSLRAQLLEAMAHEQNLTGQVAHAIEARHAALELRRDLGDRVREGENLRELSRLYWYLARPAEAERAARKAIELLEELGSGPELSMAYANWSGLRMLAGDWDEAIRTGERVIELAAREEDTATLVHALNIVGCARFKRGDHEEGKAQLERSLRLSLAAGAEQRAALAYGNLGWMLAMHYRLDEAERYLLPGIAFSTEHDLEVQRIFAEDCLAVVRLHQGRWTEAVALAEQAGASTDVATSRIHALITLARAAARTGQGEAAPLLDEALEIARRSAQMVRVACVRAARAEDAWLAGDLDRVRQEARADLALATRHPNPRFAGELLSWLARTGEAVEAPHGLFRPFQLQVEGRWEEAAAEWRRLGCPYEAADALSETGDPAQLRRALSEFRRLGATPAAQLTARRLREAGVRSIPRGPRSSTRRNPAQLTSRQVEVVQLLAEGLPDAEIATRLFISPKTVGHHVSAVLAKLEVRSRIEAAREAVRLGIVQDREREPQR